MTTRIINADVMDGLGQLPDESVHCVVTSPPYWGLRDYGTATWEGGDPNCDQPGRNDKQSTQKGSSSDRVTRDCRHCGAIRIDNQIGLEATPEAFVTRMVQVFREVRRVLRSDGVCWLNLGDSYASAWVCNRRNEVGNGSLPDGTRAHRPNRLVGGLKEKDLVGIPWRVALALQADGWWLRADIIWAKPNPMPESVTDRPTKAHEYVFLLTKAERYFYDAEAIKEAAVGQTTHDLTGNGYSAPGQTPHGGNRSAGKNETIAAALPERRRGHARKHIGFNERWDAMERAEQCSGMRNKRSVWTVATTPFNGSGLLADYVGADGKPYTRSEDCPIHGLMGRHRIPQMGEGGGLSDHPATHNLGNNGHPCEGHEGAHDAISLTTSDKNAEESSREHEPQSMGAHKKRGQSPMLFADGSAIVAESPRRNENTAVSTIHQLGKTDLPGPAYSAPAKPRSSGIRKTDRAPETNLACSAAAQMATRIDDTIASLASSDAAAHKPENRTERACLDDPPSGQSSSHNADSSSPSPDHICTCRQVSTDHFATFPPELVEPMILAGTSAKGCCVKCEAPWERQIERQKPPLEVYTKRNAPRDELVYSGSRVDGEWVGHGQKLQNWLDEHPPQTIGWKPVCNCATGIVPCTVLDPFSGAGTLCLVADRLQRNAIGIELNPSYVVMSERRIHGDRGGLLDLMEGSAA